MPYTPEQKAAPKVPVRRPGQKLSDDHRKWFYDQVKTGKNPYKVGQILGISRTTTRRLMKDKQGAVSTEKKKLKPAEIAAKLQAASEGVMPNFADIGADQASYPDPILDFNKLNSQAQQAYREFGYFRRRYFNRRHIPWQIEMVQVLMSWKEVAEKTNEVMKGILNTPPGGGKTTTVTHDFPSWLQARDRNMRIALGARTRTQAEKYARRLRTTYEKNPLLNYEFGRFKPLEPELWRRDAFIIDGVTGHLATVEYKLALAGFDFDDPSVRQRYEDPDDPIHEMLEALENVFLTGEKEASIEALSQELGFLGGRYHMCIWDDLCDRANSRTVDQRDALQEWWFAEAESRAEPGGIVGLIGTRFGKYDLYRYCRDLTYQTEDDMEEQLLDSLSSSMTEGEMAEIRADLEKEMVDKYGYEYGELHTPTATDVKRTRRVYQYYKFPAHDEKKCKAPSSRRRKDHIDCVLDPKRFDYLHLLKVEASDPRKYRLTYQQEDESTEDNLVQKVWLTGGREVDGTLVPGCYNYSRKLLQIPGDLDPQDVYSIATVDPSGERYWSIQWWLWDKRNDMDYLINLLRIRMMAGNFLDYNLKHRTYTGVMDQWQAHSRGTRFPIKMWIIEQNAAQRYLFQYSWVKDWMKARQTLIKGHETGRNKADEELGVQSLGPRYRLGLVDLPFDQSDLRTRVTLNEFAKELTEWPDSPTDDMVNGHWFLQWNRWQMPDSLRAARPQDAKTIHPYTEDMPAYVREEEIYRSPNTVGHRVAQQRQHRGGVE